MSIVHLDQHVSVAFKRGTSRNSPSVYLVRRDGVVIGRFLSRAAAYRKAKDAVRGGMQLPMQAPQKFAIGLFRDVKA